MSVSDQAIVLLSQSSKSVSLLRKGPALPPVALYHDTTKIALVAIVVSGSSLLIGAAPLLPRLSPRRLNSSSTQALAAGWNFSASPFMQ